MKNKISVISAIILAFALLGTACVFAASTTDGSDNRLNVHVTSNVFDSCDMTVENTSSRLRVTFEFYSTMNIEQLDFRMNYDSTVLSPTSGENSAELSCPNISGVIFNPTCMPSDEYADNADMLSVAAAATDFRNPMDFSSEKKVFVTVLFDIIDPSAGETAIDLVVRDLYLKEADAAADSASTRVVYISDVDEELTESIVISAESYCEEIAVETSPTAADETTAPETETQPTSEPDSTTSTIPTASTAAPSAPEYAYGDVNRDGVVDITDATEIQKYVAQITTFDDEQSIIADVNGSGAVDITDVTYVQKFVARIITAFSVQIG